MAFFVLAALAKDYLMHILMWHGNLYVIFATFPRAIFVTINIYDYLGDTCISLGFILLGMWRGDKIELPF